MTEKELTAQEAIMRIIETAESTGLASFSGEFWMAGWNKSTSNAPPYVKFTVAADEDIERSFELATVKKGKMAGQRYMAVLFELNDDDQPVNAHKWEDADAKKSGKPYGKEASVLHMGWLLNDQVLEAAGTDEDFLQWLKHQPPACGHTNPPSDENPLGYSDPMHVRRVADGAGTGEKPPYSAFPGCHDCHVLQHQKGESAVHPDGAMWFDKQRIKYVSKWCGEAIANNLRHESLGFVPPAVMQAWAEDNNLKLPTRYIEAAM